MADNDMVALLTDLLDATANPASDLLDVDLVRWQHERVFQQITEVFSLGRPIGSAVEAAIFRGVFSLLGPLRTA